jgi:hypothetical protein
VDVALAADVDGVHVGQEDLPVRVVRQMMGHKKLIGCSTHSTAQALAAVGDGADYISCGPLFATPTKPDYAPVGLDLVKEYRRLVRTPFVAIGGIDESNVAQAIAAGADRVAVVRAIAGSGRCGPGRPEHERSYFEGKSPSGLNYCSDPSSAPPGHLLPRGEGKACFVEDDRRPEWLRIMTDL